MKHLFYGLFVLCLVGFNFLLEDKTQVKDAQEVIRLFNQCISDLEYSGTEGLTGNDFLCSVSPFYESCSCAELSRMGVFFKNANFYGEGE